MATEQGTKTLGIKLAPDLHAQFLLVTQTDGLTLADGVIRAVELYVKTQSQAPDFAARAAAQVEEIEREAKARRDAVQALFAGEAAKPAADQPEQPAKRGSAKQA